MSTDGTEPRVARADEFDDVLELVDRCFNAAPGGMQASNPHCYDRAHLERHAVVERDGRIVSHAACVPDALVCGADASIPCWGLSGVATDPRAAGEGHMGDLVRFWIDRMDDEDVPLARLWGDRARYGRFDFETAGRERHFRITRRSFPDPPNRDEHVFRYDGDPSFVRSLYERLPFRVARPDGRFRTLLEQRGLEVLCYRDDRRDDRAYLAFESDGRDRRVYELAGDDRGVEGLLAFLRRAYYTNDIVVPVHPRDPVRHVVRPVSVDWTDHTHKQVRINDLEAVLRRFSPQMGRRLPADARPGEFVLGIEDDASSVEVRWDAAGDLDVRTVEAAPDVRRTRAGMARLLFDEDGGASGEAPNAIARDVLPLSFFVPRTNWV